MPYSDSDSDSGPIPRHRPRPCYDSYAYSDSYEPHRDDFKSYLDIPAYNSNSYHFHHSHARPPYYCDRYNERPATTPPALDYGGSYHAGESDRFLARHDATRPVVWDPGPGTSTRTPTSPSTST